MLKSSLPYQATPFVGRNHELGEIARLLEDPACRLLTLVGPGGVGKTRLAVEAARNEAQSYADGVYFVPFHALPGTSSALLAIAENLNLTLTGHETPLAQVLGFLADREVLLVLDNLEHVLLAAEELSSLLGAAPRVKLLVTSRQALNLRKEWLYSVDGFPFPDKLNDDATYEAVSFFTRCAQRVRPDFSLEVERANVIRICQLVNGLPLALEMAAPWTKSLSCADIAGEIQRDIEFLTNNMGDAAPQHRSMMAVFDQSWKQLSSEERVVFTHLSVFQGGFDLRAAQEVAGATLPVLAGLVDKSLLQFIPGGRYQIHELTRQYAKSQLEQDHEEAGLTQQRYGCYYIEFVHKLERDLIAGQQREAINKIKIELENVRSSWYWVIATGNIEAIEKSVMATSLFYQYQSRYVEGIRMLEDVEGILRKQPLSKQKELILASVLGDLGWLRMRLGEIDRLKRFCLRALNCSRSRTPVPIWVMDSIHASH